MCGVHGLMGLRDPGLFLEADRTAHSSPVSPEPVETRTPRAGSPALTGCAAFPTDSAASSSAKPSFPKKSLIAAKFFVILGQHWGYSNFCPRALVCPAGWSPLCSGLTEIILKDHSVLSSYLKAFSSSCCFLHNLVSRPSVNPRIHSFI